MIEGKVIFKENNIKIKEKRGSQRVKRYVIKFIE